MKKRYAIFLFLGCSIFGFSQKIAEKKVQSLATQIEISTLGLDEVVLENSTSEFIEMYLTAENPNQQHLVYKEAGETVYIKFHIPEMSTEDPVFRKFITQRLQRASAIIKIPQQKSVIIFGDNINITSKSYKGPLDVYIENGIVKLDTVQASTKVKLYGGSVFASLKDANIQAVSTSGTISIDQKIQQENFYNKAANSAIHFSITTSKANIFLTTYKTQ